MPPDHRATVLAGQTTEGVDLRMYVGGAIAGTVRRRDGKPLTATYRTMAAGASTQAIAHVAPDGTFRIERVYPGARELWLARSQASKEPSDPGSATVFVRTVDATFIGTVIERLEGIIVRDQQTTNVELIIDE